MAGIISVCTQTVIYSDKLSHEYGKCQVTSKKMMNYREVSSLCIFRLLHYCISALLMDSPDSVPFLSPHKPHPEKHRLMIDVSCLLYGSYQKFAKLSISYFSCADSQITIKRLIGLQSPVIPMIMAFDIDVIR